MTCAGNHQLLPFARSLQSERHVWLARPEAVTDPSVRDSYIALLSAQEMARYRKFHFDSDRHLYLVSHALVRRVLSHYADVPPHAWQFVQNSHGKPEIAAPVLQIRLRFNLSHTPGLAACLVVLDDDCGIDVEQLSARRDVQGIAARMFAPEEQQHLAMLQGNSRREQFFNYWTLHEAYSKALGIGLACAGSQCCFVEAGSGSYRISQSGSVPESGAWTFSLSRPTAEHVLALAARNGRYRDKAVVIRWLSP